MITGTLTREPETGHREEGHRKPAGPEAHHEITKSDVDRFLFGKHLTSCAVCGRFRSQCDLDVRTLSCERGATSDCSSTSTLNVLMIVCQNCGAIEFHDRTIIGKWLESQRVAALR